MPDQQPQTLQQLAYDLANAIAIGEGYPSRTTIPWTQRNPGDLTHAPHATPTANGKFLFVSHSLGWADHEAHCLAILEGREPNYSLSMTIIEFATKYVGGKPSPGWLYPIIVTLGAIPGETLAAFVARKTGLSTPDAH